MINTTREKIACSLLALVPKKSLQKISVSDIIELAEVSRGTFYHYFTDIQDLINWIYHHEVTLPFRNTLASENETQPDLSLIHLRTLYRHRDFFCQAFRMEGPAALCNYARNEIRENWSLYVEQLAAKAHIYDPSHIKQIKTIADMIALGSINSLIDWARKGMLIPPEQFSLDMDRTILPFVQEIVSPKWFDSLPSTAK